MAAREWDDHTQCRGDEENGSFSQRYNDGEGVCSDKRAKTAGVSFSRKKEKVVRARPELGGNVVKSYSNHSTFHSNTVVRRIMQSFEDLMRFLLIILAQNE